MGASPEAALFAGIRVKRVKTMLYVVSGLVCALAGVLWTFRLSTAVQNNGLGLELDVVAIVLLGGVSIFGGKGTLAGVVLAVIAFAGLQNALLLTNFNQEATGIVIGALLLVSVFAPNAGRLWRPGPPRWARGRSGHRPPRSGRDMTRPGRGHIPARPRNQGQRPAPAAWHKITSTGRRQHGGHHTAAAHRPPSGGHQHGPHPAAIARHQLTSRPPAQSAAGTSVQPSVVRLRLKGFNV